MNMIVESERKTPVLTTADVVVVGGGPAGLVAAVAARRSGVDVLLIERHGCLGGLLTSGFVTKPQAPVVGGIPEELFARAQQLGGARGTIRYRLQDGTSTYFMSPIDPETMKRVALECVEAAGVRLLLHSLVVDAVTDDEAVTGVLVENKSGRQAIMAGVVVDASGDADVAARAGAPYEVGRRSDGVAQPMSLMFRMGQVDVPQLVHYARTHLDDFTFTHFPDIEAGITNADLSLNVVLEGFLRLQARAANERGYIAPRIGLNVKTGLMPGDVFVNATRVTTGVATNVHDLTAAEVAARRQVHECVTFLRAYVPGFADAYLLDTPAEIGVRESRRIVGDYTLTLQDLVQHRTFPDVVAKGYGVIDIHEPGGRRLRFDAVEEYQIPYRCLLPQQISGLVVAGRCVSCDHDVLGTLRTIPACMATGQAAGVAAALAVQGATTPRRVEVAALQRALMHQNVVLFDRIVDRLQAQT